MFMRAAQAPRLSSRVIGSHEHAVAVLVSAHLRMLKAAERTCVSRAIRARP
jgi:hypothetical protein